MNLKFEFHIFNIILIVTIRSVALKMSLNDSFLTPTQIVDDDNECCVVLDTLHVYSTVAIFPNVTYSNRKNVTIITFVNKKWHYRLYTRWSVFESERNRARKTFWDIKSSPLTQVMNCSWLATNFYLLSEALISS
jgi:hypothetical protein